MPPIAALNQIKFKEGVRQMSNKIDLQWYKKVWSLQIRDMSWVENTVREVDFIINALELSEKERVLDLACGFGRHALELARRGYTVVGVDITLEYIVEARKLAKERGIKGTEFICADLRDITYREEFDVVLNIADGAIGFLESDEENLKIFDLISSALKPGGKHLMGVCSGAYAKKHFPRRHWDIGNQSLSLADFQWDGKNSRMLYRGYCLPYCEVLQKPREPSETDITGYIRLYTIEELQDIFSRRGMKIWKTFGDYYLHLPASDDQFMLVVCSNKFLRKENL
jgi:SAM-dependent methyltransferase